LRIADLLVIADLLLIADLRASEASN